MIRAPMTMTPRTRRGKLVAITVDPRTGRLLRGFFGVLGAAFLGHAVYGLLTGDISFDGGYAVIEGGHHVHLTSVVGLGTGAVAFGTAGTAFLLVALDPSLVVRRTWIFVGLAISVIASVMLISLGVR